MERKSENSIPSTTFSFLLFSYPVFKLLTHPSWLVYKLMTWLVPEEVLHSQHLAKDIIALCQFFCVLFLSVFKYTPLLISTLCSQLLTFTLPAVLFQFSCYPFKITFCPNYISVTAGLLKCLYYFHYLPPSLAHWNCFPLPTFVSHLSSKTPFLQKSFALVVIWFKHPKHACLVYPEFLLSCF